MPLKNLLKKAISEGDLNKPAFDNLSSYPDMGISIIIYRLSNIYLNYIKTTLFRITYKSNTDRIIHMLVSGY